MTEADKRLAAIVDSSDDAIISKDLDGVVITWNRAAEQMFGYAAEEMIGTSIRRIIPADRQFEEDEVLAQIRRGQKVDHFETIRQRKDGSLVPISLTVSPVIDEQGKVVGASKIARDVSERRRAESENDQLYRSLVEANRLKDEFLATLSHELRTPLNTILGYTRMLRSGLLPAEKQPRALEAVERNAESLTQIVEDVLDVSRIVAGKLRLTIQSVDFADVVRRAIESVQFSASVKGIQIETEFGPTLGRVAGDPERLQQIVWNLLTNAVKFTDRGGRIRVSAERRQRKTLLIVSDDGAGIAPEFLPHLFERFRQADAGMARAHGGLGLGLAIARQLVELHGGSIEASSEGVGKGATFTVTLPAMVANVGARDSDADRFEASIELTPIAPSLDGLRILAVDDDSDALTMIRDILETSGATVLAASSAEGALKILDTEHPDVLVADLGMPRIDGFELIARIRRRPSGSASQLPAVALTAYARSEDKARALRAGYQTHMSKPINPAELVACVLALGREGAA
jgi:PAS domain S-box-containing protein